MITAKCEEKSLDVNIHGEIGQSFFDFPDLEKEENSVASVKDLQEILNKNKNIPTVNIYINSPGGSVNEGIAIYNILKRTRAYVRVFIDGFACSIASVIAMAGNAIYMPKSSMQMVHNAWTVAMGNSEELRKVADDLDKINEVVISAYMSKFKGTEKELRKLLDDESYLTAEECLKYGLCTKIVDDSENTQSNVEEGLDAATNMFENKLTKLVSIKNAIKDLDAEIVEPETANEPKGEVVNEGETVNEADKLQMAHTNVTEKEVRDNVEKTKQTELQKFFGYVPGN